jgi:hypothetical protein
VATTLKRMILAAALMVLLAGAPAQTMAARGMTMTVRFSPGYSGARGYGEAVGAASRAVYTALESLPTFPLGIWCSENNDATYHLRFFVARHLLMTATADAVCEAIDGLGWREIIGTMAGERTVFLVVKPPEAAEEVRRRLDDLRPDGGFVFATVHNIQGNVPPENIMALWETVQRYGVYG